MLESVRLQFGPSIGIFALFWTSGCGEPRPGLSPPAPPSHLQLKVDASTPSVPKPPSSVSSIRFRAEELPFSYERGETGAAWPVETTGGGVGLLDYDGDGDLDLFFAQGVQLPVQAQLSADLPGDTLLRNDGGGQFVDVSRAVGLTPKGYGQGIVVADYDGDGDPDVYVTRYGANTLWRNDREEKRFVDVTHEAGVGCPLWSLGAAFLDYDRDGNLDLFVANYLHFKPDAAPFARDPQTNAPRYGAPAQFPGLPDVLYRNNGDGTFTDVTTLAGVAGSGRGMGCLAADFDADGWVDVLVANDAEPNTLWRNRQDGTFEDVAPVWGISVNGQGQSEANMGIAHGDTDGDGYQDVIITHFYGEHDTLWRKDVLADGRPFFEDHTREAGLAVDTLPMTAWGLALADFDQDGLLDLFIANGHIRPEAEQFYTYENPPLLLRQGRRPGRFDNVSTSAGEYFEERYVSRGLAVGDLDHDGDLEVVIVHHHRKSSILWNETSEKGHFLILDLRGSPPNIDAIGARVKAHVDGRLIVRSIDGGGSYLSSHDRRVHLGLGSATHVDHLEVTWPNGLIETRTSVPADGVLVWTQSGKDAGRAYSPSRNPRALLGSSDSRSHAGLQRVRWIPLSSPFHRGRLSQGVSAAAVDPVAFPNFGPLH